MTSDPTIYGEATDYDTLRQVLMRVREIRNMSCEELDRLAGWPDGLASKSLTAKPSRRLGPVTIGGGLGGLEVKLLIVDDPDGLLNTKRRAGQRDKRQVRNGAMHSGAVHLKVSLKKFKLIGAIGGHNSRKYVTRRKASQLGRRASLCRWAKVKMEKRAKVDSAQCPDTMAVQPTRQRAS